jgi:formiminoglutamase
MKRDFKSYMPADKSVWQGRVDDPDDIDSFRWHQWVEFIDLSGDLPEPLPQGTPGFCFLGFRCDRGVVKNCGRPGAAKAPRSIRQEMANLPLRFGRQTRIFDAGDLHCSHDTTDTMETAQAQLADMVEKIVSLNLFPIVLGGGHDIAFGHYNGLVRAVSKRNADARIGIINFDAHFDLRPYNKGANSGTMFLQIADKCAREKRDFSYFCVGIQKYANTISLFKKADALSAEYVLAKDIEEAAVPGILDRLDRFVERQNYIYLTLCADVFSSAYAPGVSAPQPFGLHPEKVVRPVKHILRSGKVIGFDIAEVSPRFDEDNRTAKLAAVMIFAVINTLTEGPEASEE